MTLIKMFFISQLNLLAVEVSEKSNKSLNDMAVQALLYSKFVSVAQPMRPLLYELEKRAVSDPDEYGALLSDCHAAWFAVRNALLSERVTQEVQSMEPYTADIIKLVCSSFAGAKQSRSLMLSPRLVLDATICAPSVSVNGICSSNTSPAQAKMRSSQ